MTDEEKQLLEKTIKKLDAFLDIYYRTHFIDKDVFTKDMYLPEKMAFFGSDSPKTRQTAITAPSGGATVDSQARTAINDIITKLQALNLTA